MTITKSGVLPEDRVYGGECSHCGCEILCSWSELDHRCMVKCPTPKCSGNIYCEEVPKLEKPGRHWNDPLS